MSEPRQVLLIHPLPESAPLPGLADALRRAGARVQEIRLTDDHRALLDALEGDVLPVVVKG